jgi:serine/threonine protein kinase
MGNTPTRRDLTSVAAAKESAPVSAPTTRDAAGASRVGLGPTSAATVALPPPLSEKYVVCERLCRNGGEADVWLAKDKTNNSDVVVKLYHFGVAPKPDVLEQVKALGREHVIGLFAYGQTSDSDAKWYEVLEYAPHGSLEAVFGGRKVEPAVIRTLVSEVHFALAHFHAEGLCHRDLKPANVLVRSREPWDLVLADFGIARSVNAARRTTLGGTRPYEAPEYERAEAGIKVDYWALGIMVMEWIHGANPWDGLSNETIRHRLDVSAFDFTITTTDPTLERLCEGLLTRDPDTRWGASELTAWIAGKDPAVRRRHSMPRKPTPFHVAGQDCFSLQDLAYAFAQHWREGVEGLVRGEVLCWVRDELRNADVADFISQLTDQDTVDLDRCLLVFLDRIAPKQPRVYKGVSLSREDLYGLANDALRGDVTKSTVIQDLRERDILASTTSALLLQIARAWAAGLAILDALPQSTALSSAERDAAALFIATEPERDLSQPLTKEDFRRRNLLHKASEVGGANTYHLTRDDPFGDEHWHSGKKG